MRAGPCSRRSWVTQPAVSPWGCTTSGPGTSWTCSRRRAGSAASANSRSLQPGQSLGSGTKASDLTDAEAAEALSAALGAKFRCAWVNPGAGGWVASAYHIKVAVRDGEACWLSSGNWQSSSQPNGEPLTPPWEPSWLRSYNSEWHVVVEHPGVAADLERYLLHDYTHNLAELPAARRTTLPDLLLSDDLLGADEALRSSAAPPKPVAYVPPLRATRVFDVQPLLTPDNYHAHTLALIQSAKRELLIQNQTFNAPRPGDTQLHELLSAILAKQRAGVAVRILFRILAYPDAHLNLERLQDFGFDMARIRLQPRCHTKGIVVDRRRVLLGSQNLSEQGVSINRDASLLVRDPALARYFADLFEYDWANLATDSLRFAPSVSRPATAEAPPPGTRLLPARECADALG